MSPLESQDCKHIRISLAGAGLRAQLDEALRKVVAEELPDAFETTRLETAGDHLKQRIGAEARLALPRTTEPE
jgi:hypothetical protein